MSWHLENMAPKKFYVVFQGRQHGIFEDWVECHKATNGYRGNVFKTFLSFEEAEQAWLSYKNANKEAPSTTTKQKDSKAASSSNAKYSDPHFDPPLPPQPPLRWLKRK